MIAQFALFCGQKATTNPLDGGNTKKTKNLNMEGTWQGQESICRPVSKGTVHKLCRQIEGEGGLVENLFLPMRGGGGVSTKPM